MPKRRNSSQTSSSATKSARSAARASATTSSSASVESQSQPGPSASGGSGQSEFCLPSLDFQVDEPTRTTSSFDPIGGHVPQKLREKIWEGQFIDLSLLLKTARDLETDMTQGELKIQDGKIIISKNERSSYLTIERWTSAFLIYMSIYLEKYRTRAQELLKYMRDIRLAASRSNGWFKYDEQFRLRMSADIHSSWASINTEFWLLYISGSQRPSTDNAVKGNPLPPVTLGSTVKNYCNHYNSGNNCRFFPRCRYKHACKSCDGQHPSVRCPKGTKL